MTYAIPILILEQSIKDMESNKRRNQDMLDSHLSEAHGHMIARDASDRKITELKQALMTLRDAQPKEAMGLVSDSMRSFNRQSLPSQTPFFAPQQSTNQQCVAGKAPRVLE